MHLSSQIWLDSDQMKCFKSLVRLEIKHFIAFEEFSIKKPTRLVFPGNLLKKKIIILRMIV